MLAERAKQLAQGKRGWRWNEIWGPKPDIEGVQWRSGWRT